MMLKERRALAEDRPVGLFQIIDAVFICHERFEYSR